MGLERDREEAREIHEDVFDGVTAAPAPGLVDAAVWERMGQLMPNHDCGRRLRPGGTEALGPLAVCPPCSYIAAVDEGWVESLAAQARAQLASEGDES